MAGQLTARAQVGPVAPPPPVSPPSAHAEPISLTLIEGLSGPFGNAGEAVWRNLVWATDRVNASGGVRLPGARRRLALQRFDSKGTADQALSVLRSALDQRIGFVVQGNSSAIAHVLLDALNKHNERTPQARALFLNYSAVDPALRRERCSFWHFRFDADTGMRLAALMDVLQDDRSLSKVLLIGQDYSFGQQAVAEWHPNVAGKAADALLAGFQAALPRSA